MQNTQKGFVVPLVIILVIAAIGGGIYYATRTVLKEYRDPTGVLAIKYPEGWTPEKITDGVKFTSPNGNTLALGVDPRPGSVGDLDKVLAQWNQLAKPKYYKSEIVIDSQKAYKLSVVGTTTLTTRYFAPLSGQNTQALYGAAIVVTSRDNSESWYDQAVSVAESVKFDLSKLSPPSAQ